MYEHNTRIHYQKKNAMKNMLKTLVMLSHFKNGISVEYFSFEI